jgi:hypothetical protein
MMDLQEAKRILAALDHGGMMGVSQISLGG